MARSRRKKSLYEVISRTWPKPDYGRTGEQLHPEKSDKDEPTTAKPAMATPERAAQWPRRPKIVQFNAGRIEISMPYQLAIAVLLAIVLLVLVVFRLGQILSRQKATDSATKIQKIEQERPTGLPTTSITRTPESAEKGEPVKPKNDNVIVLVEYGTLADLVPVQRHFAEHDIETEIVPAPNGRYFLWTKERYENTDTRGAAGYEAKQRIKEVGRLYKGKAPEGYETFAPHYFSDAYGRKVE